MSSVAKGNDYEVFIQELFQALYNQSEQHAVNINRNIQLTGKSGTSNQIDIYWEFSIAGIKYRNFIECRNYTSSLKKDHIAAFALKVQDIGDITGIMVTTEGYQEGAVELAKFYGIRLFVINSVAKTIEINLTLSNYNWKISKIELDEESKREMLILAGISSFPCILHGKPDEIIFYDENGNPKTSILDMFPDRKLAEGHFSFYMTERFLKTEIGLIRMKKIEIMVQKENWTEQICYDIPTTCKAIMNDIINNSKKQILDDGTITET